MFFRTGFFAKKIGAVVAGGVGVWGAITGTLSDQTDLQSALDAKAASFTQFKFTADSNTGFDNPTADVIDLVTGGAVAWKILSTGELRGPDAATSSSAGTTRVVRGGPGGSTSGAGGLLELRGGVPVDGIGGAISIITNAGVGSGRNGGQLVFGTGNSGASGNARGGDCNITLGNGIGNERGGIMQFIGGNGGSSGNGGYLEFTSGNCGTSSSSLTTGRITFGTASTTFGTSGDIEFVIGEGTDATHHGNILFKGRPGGVLTTGLKINGKELHIIHTGSSPTITSGGGTSPSIAGKDEAFLVTVGTGGVATSVEVTFANAFTNAPVASVGSDTDIVAFKWTTTTTKITITATAPFTAGSKLHVICRGYE